MADARVALAALRPGDWRADASWTARATQLAAQWRDRVSALTTAAVPAGELPYDAEVIGAVRDSAEDSPGRDVVVCAAGTLPAELHNGAKGRHLAGEGGRGRRQLSVPFSQPC